MTDIHDAAQRGFSTGAPAYVRGRPDYPDTLLPWLQQALGVQAGSDTVDLGAGTGKFTALLARTGARVHAVEPVEAMLAQLTRALPGVQALAGSAQAIPLPDGSADSLVCAQAFHWFATPAALAEIHRVLRPGGRLGLVWNVRDESVDWVAEITRIVTPYEGDAPRFYKGDWKRPFDDGRLFSRPELSVLPHQHVGPPQEVIVDRVLSVSFIAALPDDEKARVRARLLTLVADHPDLRGHDRVAFPYRTEAWLSRRLEA